MRLGVIANVIMITDEGIQSSAIKKSSIAQQIVGVEE